MLFVEYEGADDLVGDFTENLSSGGTFVSTARPLPIETRVRLVLSFPGLLEPISIEGVVRWHRSDEDGGSGACRKQAHRHERGKPIVAVDETDREQHAGCLQIEAAPFDQTDLGEAHDDALAAGIKRALDRCRDLTLRNLLSG